MRRIVPQGEDQQMIVARALTEFIQAPEVSRFSQVLTLQESQ